jgi:hypothetical protein
VAIELAPLSPFEQQELGKLRQRYLYQRSFAFVKCQPQGIPRQYGLSRSFALFAAGQEFEQVLQVLKGLTPPRPAGDAPAA